MVCCSWDPNSPIIKSDICTPMNSLMTACKNDKRCMWLTNPPCPPPLICEPGKDKCPGGPCPSCGKPTCICPAKKIPPGPPPAPKPPGPPPAPTPAPPGSKSWEDDIPGWNTKWIGIPSTLWIGIPSIFLLIIIGIYINKNQNGGGKKFNYL